MEKKKATARAAKKATKKKVAKRSPSKKKTAKKKPTKKKNSLKELAAKAKKAEVGIDEVVDPATKEELQTLSEMQQSLVRAVGEKIWNQLTPLERRMIRCLMAERGNVARAAMRAGLQRSFHYEHKEREVYVTASNTALEIIHDLIEHAVISRGYRGVKKIVRYKGMPVPVTDPRVPIIQNPETGQPYMVPDPHDPENMIPFRGYETDIEFSDPIGLHTIKHLRPDKWNTPDRREQKIVVEDASAIESKLAGLVGFNPEEADPLDQSYKLKKG